MVILVAANFITGIMQQKTSPPWQKWPKLGNSFFVPGPWLVFVYSPWHTDFIFHAALMGATRVQFYREFLLDQTKFVYQDVMCGWENWRLAWTDWSLTNLKKFDDSRLHFAWRRITLSHKLVCCYSWLLQNWNDYQNRWQNCSVWRISFLEFYRSTYRQVKLMFKDCTCVVCFKGR